MMTKGLQGAARPIPVMISVALRWRALARAGAVAAGHVLAFPHAALVLVAIAGNLGYRLLAERTRRRTLVALVQASPGGTVVMMNDGPGGPAMWVRVGDGPRPLPLPEAWCEP